MSGDDCDSFNGWCLEGKKPITLSPLGYTPKVTVNEWVKVSDKLPDDGQECWVYVTGNRFGNKFIDRDTWDEGCWQMWENGVSHWMPYYTPEPPRE